MTKFDNPITDYWHKHYTYDGLCSLCGNSGILNTTGARTAAGKLVGRFNYCICPNGQGMRKMQVLERGKAIE